MCILMLPNQTVKRMVKVNRNKFAQYTTGVTLIISISLEIIFLRMNHTGYNVLLSTTASSFVT